MNRFRKTLKSTQAAIDLASIMVGILVIGIIGGVVGATVFAVIPWAQDNAAKEELRAVKQAQAVYAGLASTNDVIAATAGGVPLAFFSPTNFTTPVTLKADGNPTFASYDQLVKNKLISSSDRIGLGVGAGKDCYAITAFSNTGKVFWLDSADGNRIRQYSESSASECSGVDLKANLPVAYTKSLESGATPVTPPTTAPPTSNPSVPTTEPTTPPTTATPKPGDEIPVGTVVYNENFESSAYSTLPTGWTNANNTLTSSTVSVKTANANANNSQKTAYYALFAAGSTPNQSKILEMRSYVDNSYIYSAPVTLKPGTYTASASTAGGSAGWKEWTFYAMGGGTVLNQTAFSRLEKEYVYTNHNLEFTVTKEQTVRLVWTGNKSGSTTPYQMLDDIKITKIANSQ